MDLIRIKRQEYTQWAGAQDDTQLRQSKLKNTCKDKKNTHTSSFKINIFPKKQSSRARWQLPTYLPEINIFKHSHRWRERKREGETMKLKQGDPVTPTVQNTQQHTCSMGRCVLIANCASLTPNIRLRSCGLQMKPAVSRWTRTNTNTTRHVPGIKKKRRRGWFCQSPNMHAYTHAETNP